MDLIAEINAFIDEHEGILARYHQHTNDDLSRIEGVCNQLQNEARRRGDLGIGDSERISIPDESLASGSANCIDGAVLFASAIERLGM